MEMVLLLGAAGLGVRALAGIARRMWRQDDALRRRSERASYEERQLAGQADRSEVALGKKLDSFFPYLRTDVAARMSSGASPEAALREAILATPGVRLGTNHLGLPVVVPSAFRTRTVALIGKSGSGKSSVMIRMIQKDLLSGQAVIVVCPEREMFEEYLLGLIPDSRIHETLYLAPGRSSAITCNSYIVEPGDEPSLLSAELYSGTKRALGEDGSLGSRSDPMLANATALVVGLPDASLAAVRRVFTDEVYRAAAVARTRDPHLRDYWTRVYLKYPSGAEIPLLNRLDGFLRNPAIRNVLTNPVSSVSMRSVIEKKQVLLVDLSGLSPEDMRLFGELIMAKLQIELIRMERVPSRNRSPTSIYIDEFPAVVGTSEETWRTLLSRGRKYGAAITVGFQHGFQLGQRLREELFGNTSSLFVFNVGAKSGSLLNRELLMPRSDGSTKPVAVEDLVSLGVGEAFGRVGTGTCAVRVTFDRPIPEQDRARAAMVREVSWKTFGVPPIPENAMTPALPAVGSQSRMQIQASDAESDLGHAGTPGRGGQLHKEIQHLVRTWSEEMGFKATLEQEILGGAGRVDVALAKDGQTIAVEVAVSSKTKQISASVNRYIAAGFSGVLVVSTDDEARPRIEAALDGAVTTKDRGRVRVLSPEGTRLYLAGQSSGEDARKRPAGYRIKLKYEPASAADSRERLRTFAKLLGAATGRGRA